MKSRKKKKTRTTPGKGRIYARVLGKAVLVACVVALSAVGARAGYQTVLDRGYFDVESVEISGARMTDKAAIRKTFGAGKARSIFDLDIRQIGESIENYPWVRFVKIRRQLPSTIRVTVRERTPSAVVSYGSDGLLVDAQGVVLQKLGKFWAPSLPVVTGLGVEPGKFLAGDRIEDSRLESAIIASGKMEGYRLFGAGKLVSLDVSTPGRLAMKFDHSSVIVICAERGWSDEVERLRTVDFLLRGEEKNVKSIDLTFADEVIVRRAVGTNMERG